MPTASETAQILAIGRGITQLTERSVRKITLDVHANLVEHTPVDTGWARANWVPRTGVPLQAPVGQPGSGGVAAAAAASSTGIAKVLSYALTQGKVFVTNNVPYIERLNNGYSRQEPAGFVQRAIRRAVARAGFGSVP